MVQQITAGGELRPFIFNYGALKRFCADTERKLSEINLDKLDFQEIESMMFRGFQAGAAINNTPFTFTIEKMEDWLNEDFGLIEVVSQAVANSFNTSKKNQAKPKLEAKK